MTAHLYEVHEKCEKAHCLICDGGLAVCTVCGGAEGTLTTECPEYPLTRVQQQEVYAGRADFIGGGWELTDRFLSKL